MTRFGRPAEDSDTSTTGSLDEKSFLFGDDVSVSMQTLGSGPRVCDFDKGAPELYQRIQEKKWQEVIMLADSLPEQASTWVFRKERNGSLRWKLLPLHAALVFKAPEKVIDSLLAAYPIGAQSRDDQGMLPIHLAFRNGASHIIVNTLLVSFPESIHVKDRKGRVPLALAQASASPNKEVYLRILERGPSYYAVAAAATERAAVTAEQRVFYDAKMKDVEKEHKEEIEAEKKKAEQNQESLVKQYAELKMKSERLEKVNSDREHENSILKSKQDKNTGSGGYLKQLADEKDKYQEEYQKEKQKVSSMQARLDALESAQKNVEYLTTENARLKGNLEDISDTNICKDMVSDEELKQFEGKMEFYKTELATKNATIAVLECQLSSKMISEQTLAVQLSDLANNLAKTSEKNRTTAAAYMKREAELMQDKLALKAKVKALIKKLHSVAVTMNRMEAENNIIKERATESERIMRTIEAEYLVLHQATRNQEESLTAAQHQRENILNLFSDQALSLGAAEEEMKKTKNVIDQQNMHLKANKKEQEMISSIFIKQGKYFQLSITEINDVIRGADPDIGIIGTDGSVEMQESEKVQDDAEVEMIQDNADKVEDEQFNKNADELEVSKSSRTSQLMKEEKDDDPADDYTMDQAEESDILVHQNFKVKETGSTFAISTNEKEDAVMRGRALSEDELTLSSVLDARAEEESVRK